MAQLMDSLDPWIEKEAFDAIVRSKQVPETKFVQVLQRSPQLLLSDKRAHIVCVICSDNSEENIAIPKTIQVGSLVKLSRYQFVAATPSDETIVDGACSIQLKISSTDGIQLVGAQGMGIVGDPVDIHDTVQVRRALESIHMDSKLLKRRLMMIGTRARTRNDISRKADGDPLALLQDQDRLAQGGDESQERPRTQQFTSPPRGKLFLKNPTEPNPLELDEKVLDKIMGDEEETELEDLYGAPEIDSEASSDREEASLQQKKKRLGNALALLDDGDKLEKVMGEGTDNYESSAKVSSGNATTPRGKSLARKQPKNKKRLGNPIALLDDDVKLDKVMGGSDKEILYSTGTSRTTTPRGKRLPKKTPTNKKRLGNPLALLDDDDKLEKVMGEVSDDEIMYRAGASRTPTRGKCLPRKTPKGKKRLGDPLALIDDDDKLGKVMGADDKDGTDEDDAYRTVGTKALPEKTPKGKKEGAKLQDNLYGSDAAKMGDPMALLADDSKLQEIGGVDDDNIDNGTGPETQNAARTESPPRDQSGDEYEIPLKASPSRSLDKPKSPGGRPRSLSNVSPVPLSDGEGDNEELQDRLAAVAEEARDKRVEEDDDTSSDTSDPIGISDMLLPPTQQNVAVVAPAPVRTRPAPINRKRLLVGQKAGPVGGKRGRGAGVRIKAPSTNLSRQRPDFLSAASPRETSTATQPTANLSTPSDEEYLRRFRKTRAFLDNIWEQRNNKVIKFT